MVIADLCQLVSMASRDKSDSISIDRNQLIERWNRKQKESIGGEHCLVYPQTYRHFPKKFTHMALVYTCQLDGSRHQQTNRHRAQFPFFSRVRTLLDPLIEEQRYRERERLFFCSCAWVRSLVPCCREEKVWLVRLVARIADRRESRLHDERRMAPGTFTQSAMYTYRDTCVCLCICQKSRRRRRRKNTIGGKRERQSEKSRRQKASI